MPLLVPLQADGLIAVAVLLVLAAWLEVREVHIATLESAIIVGVFGALACDGLVHGGLSAKNTGTQ